jgi:hypothetical protein
MEATMTSARIYSRTGELLLMMPADQVNTAWLAKKYPGWATIIVTREVSSGAGIDVDAIWENLVSLEHRDGTKWTYR